MPQQPCGRPVHQRRWSAPFAQYTCRMSGAVFHSLHPMHRSTFASAVRVQERWHPRRGRQHPDRCTAESPLVRPSNQVSPVTPPAPRRRLPESSNGRSSEQIAPAPSLCLGCLCWRCPAATCSHRVGEAHASCACCGLSAGRDLVGRRAGPLHLLVLVVGTQIVWEDLTPAITGKISSVRS